MNRIVRYIKNRNFDVGPAQIQQTPSTVRSTFPRTPPTKSPFAPRLPAEVWLIILEFAVRPSLITDLDFEPSQIDLAYKCLIFRTYYTQHEAEKMVSKASRALRSVCTLWKSLIDQIDLATPWVLDEDCRALYPKQPHVDYSDKGPPTDTKKHIRLNRVVQMVGAGEYNVKMPYSHPISVLYLEMWSYSPEACLLSLSDTISFPDHLRVLSIDINTVQLGQSILPEIQASLKVLTTLRLCVRPRFITASLEFPTITSLFLWFLDDTLPTESTNSFRWKLPNLRNLSLVGPSAGQPLLRSINMNTFFYELIRDHIDLLQSLRIDPLTTDITDTDSPISWLRMPKLKALSINFNHLWFDPKRRYQRQTTSVRHLIHTGHFLSPSYPHDRVRYFIQACPYLEAAILALSCARISSFYEVISRFALGYIS
jgi:hypothetical protein